MSIRRRTAVALTAALLCSLSAQPGMAHDGNVGFDDHWLAAACTQVPSSGGRLMGRVVETASGVAVQHHPRSVGTLVLHANIEPDPFHNLIRLIAEDNSPNGFVRATIYRQNIETGAPPDEVVSVTTTDQPGVQMADFFFDPPFEPNELVYMYYLRIDVHRDTRDTNVRVYSVSMRDVL